MRLNIYNLPNHIATFATLNSFMQYIHTNRCSIFHRKTSSVITKMCSRFYIVFGLRSSMQENICAKFESVGHFFCHLFSSATFFPFISSLRDLNWSSKSAVNVWANTKVKSNIFNANLPEDKISENCVHKDANCRSVCPLLTLTLHFSATPLPLCKCLLSLC